MKRFLAISLFLTVSVGAAHAGIVLQAAHMVGVDGSGSASGGIWTAGADACCAVMNVTEGGTYATSVAFALPSTLSDGTLHLYFAGYAFGLSNLAVDLFFDSATNSGDAAQITVLTNGTSTISGTGTQIGYANSGSHPNGGLSYTSGSQTVTASNFQILDLTNSIVAFDLTTTSSTSNAAATPEPSSFLLLGGALLAVLVRHRRR